MRQHLLVPAGARVLLFNRLSRTQSLPTSGRLPLPGAAYPIFMPAGERSAHDYCSGRTSVEQDDEEPDCLCADRSLDSASAWTITTSLRYLGLLDLHGSTMLRGGAGNDHQVAAWDLALALHDLADRANGGADSTTCLGCWKGLQRLDRPRARWVGDQARDIAVLPRAA